MEKILEIKNLKKNYGERSVLKDLSFSVNKGEILCFLGPNGAGKSTTINILTGSLSVNGGKVLYKGEEIKKCKKKYKRNLGVVPQDLALYEDLPAIQNVRFFASLYGLKGEKLENQVEKALDYAGLLDRKNDIVKTFSGGMKRRLNIACAIAHEPEIVIMDEPTVGIDPQSRNHILDSIRKLRDAGMTIIYTTHYMEEVEAISTRIIIMDNGKIIAEGTNESLKEDIQNEKTFILNVEDTDKLNADDFYNIEGIKNVDIDDDEVVITSMSKIENLDKIISTVMKCKAKISNLYCKKPSLETVFLKLTGKSLRD